MRRLVKYSVRSIPVVVPPLVHQGAQAMARTLSLGTVRATLTSEVQLSVTSLLECRLSTGEYPLRRGGVLTVGEMKKEISIHFIEGEEDGE